ncbi:MULTISPECIES: hypothetical protein [Rhodococcus]|uniref:Uncharacterized protein n=1 Tax=Rhodococcus oxybenzonivorans TaxID=1990687 RepID=A0AAE4V1G1_9NOCA|nr:MULTISPECIES: hypothetical protein [Rhodococcus]MDV7246761.1 hypothetical protein [Rhodococcus oxybenzonivorans]MDV7267086.1 hypothetical protein [Rhodococcus oxybenzonivorans]MDV7278355.1 hypothetical protein [Rhodococcus oxybenzonivorans]MDV7337775.1 hypothetical protein [Rhodococcus oxybenzonivorans]MDV7346723.1 hypothetical protein [Rhodococcus oxybenzonivorans]
MSQQATNQYERTRPAASHPAPNHRPRRIAINPDDLSNLPTRKGRAGAVEFFAEIGVAGITETRIRNATEQGELRRFKIAGHNWYSDRDLWDFLQGLASGGRA